MSEHLVSGLGAASAQKEVETAADLGAASTPIDSAPNDLLSYKRTEINFVSDLRRILDLGAKINLNPAILDLARGVLARIEEKHFTIAVVGEFKRGKSTFINALLGRDILPADIQPCSATLNRVTFGLRPAVFIQYKAENGGRREEIPIDQLAEYVTKLTPQSEVTASQIEEAIIQFPSEYCRNNVDIIDTPGLNDSDGMTAVTLSIIPKVDAAIFVIMPEAPFAGTEGEFLTKHLLLQDLGRVIFVVNAIDRVRPKDRERIVTSIEERIVRAVEGRLREQFQPDSEEYLRYRQQIGRPNVFPLSAYNALSALESNDPRELEQSQFPKFKSVLEHFLTHTRGAIELQVLANRILAGAEECNKKINIELGALGMVQEEFQTAYDKAVGQLESLRRRRDEEIRMMETAASRTQQRIEPLAALIPDGLRTAALDVISKAAPSEDDLTDRGLPAYTEALSAKVSEAVKIRALRAGEQLQFEIERNVQTEIERLHDFAQNVAQTLQGIECQFVSVHVEAAERPGGGSESVAAAVAVFTGFGGIYSGYREAGFKGAALGGVASVGTVAVGAVIAGLLGVTIALPLVIGLGIVSIFTGGWAARKTFKADRAERFLARYRSAIIGKLNEEMEKRNFAESARQRVDEIFTSLREKLIGEITASIDQTRSTLEELRSRKARDEALTEAKSQELESIRHEVTTIQAKALRLSNQLAEETVV